jgi:hypothetical protein
MKFKINFDLNDKKKLFEYWDDIIKIMFGLMANIQNYLKKNGQI